MITKTTKNPIKLKNGKEIPAGVEVKLDFNSGFPNLTLAQIEGQPQLRLLTKGLFRYFAGFQKPPTLRTLEKRLTDGISRSVTGYKVEPDGYGPDGSPSWELVLGYI